MSPETIKNTIQIILEGLETLALKLQVPVKFLWSLALRQVYVELFGAILGGVVFGVLIFLWVKLLKYGLGRESESSNNRFYDNDGLAVATFFSGIILGALGIVIICCMLDIIPVALINPQWRALEILMKMVK